MTADGSETWGARISRAEADRLRRDAALLGPTTRADVVRVGLDLLRRDVADEQMARSIDDFYGGALPRRPVGVRRRGQPDQRVGP